MKFKIGNDIIETERVRKIFTKNMVISLRKEFILIKKLNIVRKKILININLMQDDLLQKKQFLKQFLQDWMINIV